MGDLGGFSRGIVQKKPESADVITADSCFLYLSRG